MRQNETKSENETRMKWKREKLYRNVILVAFFFYKRDYFSLLDDLLVRDGFLFGVLLLSFFGGGIIYTSGNGFSLPGSS